MSLLSSSGPMFLLMAIVVMVGMFFVVMSRSLRPVTASPVGRAPVRLQVQQILQTQEHLRAAGLTGQQQRVVMLHRGVSGEAHSVEQCARVMGLSVTEVQEMLAAAERALSREVV